MPIIQFLTNTVHGEARAYITQCTLAAVIEQHKKKVQKGKESSKGRGDGKPEWLPPPTDIPLRYCKHKNEAGEEIGTLSEEACLIDLLGGQPKGNEVRKNKNHYILASADTEQVQQGYKSKKTVDFRQQARLIGGVPIIYVSKSVMILEELSGVSLSMINRTEREKLKEGIISKERGTKRKRNENDEEVDGADEDANDLDREGGPKLRGQRRAKGPNPLSVRKRKTASNGPQNGHAGPRMSEQEPGKKKNRRIRGKKHKTYEDGGDPVGEISQTT